MVFGVGAVFMKFQSPPPTGPKRNRMVVASACCCTEKVPMRQRVVTSGMTAFARKSGPLSVKESCKAHVDITR